MYIKKKSLKEIDTNNDEGKMLIAAMAMLTTTSYSNSTPNEVLDKIVELSNSIYRADFLQKIEFRKDKLNRIVKSI